LGHAYSSNLIHLVFSTKGRLPLITSDIEQPLRNNVVGIGHNKKIPVIAIGGVADHVHLLFSLPAAITLSDATRTFKANSSRFMRGHNRKFAWQEGYGAFGVSHSNKDDVLKYIETQAEHHKKISFEDEFIALLRKHGVEFDSRFVLG